MTIPLILTLVAPTMAAPWVSVPAESTIIAEIGLRDNSLSRTLGHLDHGLELGVFDATIELEGKELTAVEVQGRVASLRSSTEIRKTAGLQGAIEGIELDLLMKCVFNQLRPERNNIIRFEATGIEGKLSNLSLTGDLTLNSVTQQVTMPLHVKHQGDQLRVRGELDLTLSEYGFRMPAEQWTVKDPAQVTFDLLLRPK